MIKNKFIGIGVSIEFFFLGGFDSLKKYIYVYYIV